MAGLKQEALADILGHEWSPKKVSIIESREVIEDNLLTEISKALRIPAEAIKSLSEDAVFNIISNTFNDHSNNINYQCTINPFEEMKKLMLENGELTKALLKEKDDKIALLQKLLDNK